MTDIENGAATSGRPASPPMVAQFESSPDGLPADVLWVVNEVGWPVFPVHGIERGRCTCGKADCGSPGKHPRTTNGVKDATTDLATLNAWASRFPDTNWAAEPRGGFVIDVDPRHGGFDAIEQAGISLAGTTTVRTGSGGVHAYFTLPEGVEVTNRIGWLVGVDVRATGGYVVIPPGRHSSGGGYEWKDQRLPVEASAELIGSVRSRASGGGSAPLDNTLALLNGVPEGQRDSTIFRSCCRWWRQFAHHEDGGEAAVVERALEMGRACEPPFPDEWIIAKVASAKRYAAADPQLRLSDDGNALLFVEQHGDLLRYATDTKVWHAWDGQRWIPKAETIALHLARHTSRSLVDFAKELETDSGDKQAALRHAASSLSAGRIEAMPRLAKSDPRVAIRGGEFDTDPWLLNTPSGTVDLRTGESYEHRRTDYLAKITGTGYDSNASADYWRQWVLWAMGGREDLAEFLQRAVGYAITGDTSEQVFFLLHGKGANGKTTFLTVMELILGDYAYHAEPDLLTPKDGAHPTGVADLHGRRFVVASETREGKKLDERTVKALTGQDTITARRLYQDFFEFRPTHKILFAVNHKPNITDDSHAMWRRVLLVPWDMTVEAHLQVKDLAERIVRHEGPGILAWAVEGAMKWRESGLMVPDSVRIKTSEYRSGEDSIGEFIEAHMAQVEDGFIQSAEVQAAYTAWCIQEGVLPKDRLGRTVLMSKIEDRLGVTKVRKTIGGKKLTGFEGWTATTKVPESLNL